MASLPLCKGVCTGVRVSVVCVVLRPFLGKREDSRVCSWFLGSRNNKEVYLNIILLVLFILDESGKNILVYGKGFQLSLG